MTDQDRDTSKGRGIQHYFSSTDSSSSHNTGVTPPNNNNRFGGATTLQDDKNMGINLNEQSKRKQLPIFNLNQSSTSKHQK
jgi:hypothetical protein